MAEKMEPEEIARTLEMGIGEGIHEPYKSGGELMLEANFGKEEHLPIKWVFRKNSALMVSFDMRENHSDPNYLRNLRIIG